MAEGEGSSGISKRDFDNLRRQNIANRRQNKELSKNMNKLLEQTQQQAQVERAAIAQANQQAHAQADTAEMEVERDEEEITREIPTFGRLWAAIAVTIILEVIGFSGIGIVPPIGPIVDAIGIVILIFIIGARSKWQWLYLLELGDFLLGPAGNFLPAYGVAIFAFWFFHRKMYHDLAKDLKRQAELGVRNSGFMGLSNNSLFGSFIVFLLVIVLFVTPLMALAGINVPPGPQIINTIPALQGLRDSGRIETQIEGFTIGSDIYLENLNPVNWFSNFLNDTIQNYGLTNSFTTKVEDSQGEQLGLRIKNFNTLSYNPIQENVEFEYTFTGKSFKDITVTTECWMERNNDRWNGTEDPGNFQLYEGSEIPTQVYCTIPQHVNFTKGSYRAVVSARYDFEVWSFIPYTFMDDDNIRSLLINGEDINRNFGIPKSTESLSTNGPLILGISELGRDVPQPYGLKSGARRNFSFGFLLENTESGKLKDLDKVIVMMPKGFEIDRCTTYGGDISTNQDAIRTHLINLVDDTDDLTETLAVYDFFMISNFGLQVLDEGSNNKLDFSCRANLPTSEEFLKGSNQRVSTVVIMAEYTYELKEQKVIQLKDQEDVFR